MTWTSIDTAIACIGALCAVACALPGSFLVLRRMSMMGDAISHAVLPGLAVAFIATGARSSVPMFLGAAAVGVLTALFTQWVHAFGRVDRGAAMGVVFTTLFAVGLVLIVRAADRVDLDPGCVLYGAIELAPIDVVAVAGREVPRAVLVLAIVLAVNALVIGLLWKEFRISAFDPALATTLGFSAAAMHYLLMTLVAVTTVASFEVIGSILVIAMLIVPAAAARLLSDRLGPMLLIALALAAVSAVLGHAAAMGVPALFGAPAVSTGGMTGVVLGAVFAGVLVLAPRRGLLARGLHRLRLRVRIAAEDVLGALFRLEEAGGPSAAGVTRDDLAALARDPLVGRLAILALRRSDRIERDGPVLRLTDRGRGVAVSLVRAHRLWETYLHDRLDVAADHVHGTAERMEHVTGPELEKRLSDATERARTDPHGKAIPGSDG